MVERSRRLFRQTDPPQAQARRFLLADRSASRNQPLHQGIQRQRRQALYMESRSRRNRRSEKQGVPNVGINPLEVFATKRRDRGAALKFLKRTLKRYGRPKAIVTDRRRSYSAGDERDQLRSASGGGALAEQSS